jgi:hypothetical protein
VGSGGLDHPSFYWVFFSSSYLILIPLNSTFGSV